MELYDLVKTAFWFWLQLCRLRSSENCIVRVRSRSKRTEPILLQSGKRALYSFILPLLLPIPTIWFSVNCKQQSHKQSHKKMEMFLFFWLPFHRSHDCAYNSNVWFSQGHKCSYDSTSLAIPTLTPSLVKSSLKALGFSNFCYSTALLNTIIKKNTFSSKSSSCCLKGYQLFFHKVQCSNYS